MSAEVVRNNWEKYFSLCSSSSECWLRIALAQSTACAEQWLSKSVAYLFKLDWFLLPQGFQKGYINLKIFFWEMKRGSQKLPLKNKT